MYDLLAGMVFYPLKSRLAGRILHLVERHGRETADGIALEVKMSQLEFAQMTMGSRQRVNKVLRDWVQRGILRKRNDYYVIVDLAGLQAEVEGL
jgi:CRP-like cAMP-binding protein